MASVVNTNLMSINSQRQLAKTQSAMAGVIEKLSSGKRINSARDDAAGMAVSEGMTTQIRGLAVAQRNASDGISVAQTAEGAMEEVSNNLQRIRELAVQSASGSMNDSERALLQKEVDELTNEIGRVIDSTEFNGRPLLNAAGGTQTTLNIQVGANSGEAIPLAIDGLAGLTAYTTGIDLSTEAGAAAALDLVDTDLDTVLGGRATLGALQNRFESVINNISNYSENLQAARSRIEDTDFASATAELMRTQIISQAGTSMLAQANQVPQNILSLLG